MSALVAKELQEQNEILKQILEKAYLDRIYPVGSIYMSINSTSPSNTIGGTWERIQDRFLLAAGSAYAAGSTGGSADAVLIDHTHVVWNENGFRVYMDKTGTETGLLADIAWSQNVNPNGDQLKTSRAFSTAGGDISTTHSGVGKNMPPYLAVYMWKRIA